MQLRPLRLSSLCFLALVACGDDEDAGGGDGPPETFAEACALVPGCETPRVSVAPATLPIWRVRVVRTAEGDVRVEAVQETTVSPDVGLPPSVLEGTHAVAALDGDGNPLEVHPIRFPDAVVLEGIDPVDDREEVDLADVEVDAIGYLRVSADVDTIAVVEPPDVVVASIAAPEPGEAVGEGGPVGRRGEPIVEAAPGSACAHVLLLEGQWDEIWFPAALGDGFPIREATPLRRAVVQAALNRLTPIHCAGVGRVAFTTLRGNTGGVVKNRAGGYMADLVLINADIDFEGVGFDDIALQSAISQAMLTHTTIHEAAHATTFLFDRELGREGFTGEWAPTERDLVRDTIDRVRLRGGLTKTWSRVHESFEAQGWAENYYAGLPFPGMRKEALKAAGPADLVRRGFMSAYAGHSVREDLADVASWPLVGDDFRAAGASLGAPPDANDFGCVVMGDHDRESVPDRMVAVYTKVAFLHDLGLLTDEAYDGCRGPRTGLPYDVEGIVVYQDGEAQRQFTVGPEAGIGRDDGRYVFTLYVGGTAEFGGETYDTSLELEIDLGPTTVPVVGDPIAIDRISWPRGVFAITPIERHAFRLRMPDAPAGNFDVTDGFVLVAESSNDRIVGSVVVREAFRFQAPIPVPQVFDPPLQFRFLLEN